MEFTKNDKNSIRYKKDRNSYSNNSLGSLARPSNYAYENYIFQTIMINGSILDISLPTSWFRRDLYLHRRDLWRDLCLHRRDLWRDLCLHRRDLRHDLCLHRRDLKRNHLGCESPDNWFIHRTSLDMWITRSKFVDLSPCETRSIVCETRVSLIIFI
jgi:hypothetical protein